MTDKMYGLSRKEIELLKDQAARRAANRQFYLKETYNPQRMLGGETVGDPAITRFQAMQVSHLEFFKPNRKTASYGLFMCVVPLALLAYALKTEREGRISKIRTGQVAYRDRTFKLI